MTTRRQVLTSIGVFSVLPSLVAAQSKKLHRIAFLWGSSREAAVSSGAAEAFEQGMRELGYLEKRDYVLEPYYAGGNYSDLSEIAGRVAAGKYELVLTSGAAATRAMQKVTSTTPIVFATVNDAINTGFGKSLARPGGNLTGMSRNTVDITPKHIELLRIFVPKLSRIGVLLNGGNPSHESVLAEVRSIAQKFDISVLPIRAGNLDQLRGGFASARDKHVQAVIVILDQLFIGHKEEIAKLALTNRMLSVYSVPDDVRAGGLMSYGPLYTEFFRQSARHVIKILNGAKPGDVPIEMPTRFHLAVNAKTAKALGIKIPQSILVRADKVIE